MKRFIMVLLALMCSVCSFAQQGVLPYAIDSSGVPKPNSINKPMFVYPVGLTGGTATIEIGLPSVRLATRTFTLLATDAVTLLKNVASFTDGDLLYFQSRGKMYWSQSSNPTSTAAQMQAGANVAEAGDLVGPFRIDATCNFAFVADIAAIATLSYTLCKD